MVYQRNKKTSHVTYAERVLGAFSQVQREHRRSSVHLATLRAQVKKNAQEKKDILGPNWTHWVGKAVAKLGNDGIFQPAAAIGSVTLTPTGKKTIANARRVIKNSGETPEPHAQDDRVWKQVASLGTKRSRRQSKVGGGYLSDDEEQATPAKSGTGRKRPRLSTSPAKRSKVGQAENSRLPELLRGVSPLTDLGSDDEDLSARLRERNNEPDEMTPTAEQTRSTADNENIRYATPPAIDLDRPSSPISPTNRYLSRTHLGGVVRTQSGSIIPNLSKQPTPAPSSPDRDLGDNEGASNFEMDIDTFNRPSHGRSGPSGLNSAGTGPLDRRAENQLITSLRLEIKNLQQRLLHAEDAEPEERTAGKNAAAVEKVNSQRLQSLESAVAERDTTIVALRSEKESLQEEVNDIRDSWRQVSNGLKAAESLIAELRTERDVGLGKMKVLEVSNGELVCGQADLQDALALANAESSEAKGLTISLRSQCDDLAEEIESLKRREAAETTRNHDLVQSLSQITNDMQVLRNQNASLEVSVAKYRAESQEKDALVQKLQVEANAKDIRIQNLSVQLQESVDESSVLVSQKQSAIAALSEELLSMQENAKNLEHDLDATLEELDTQKAHKEDLARHLADKVRGLEAAQEAISEDSLKIEQLTSELSLKEASIQQLSTEIEEARGHVKTAEVKLTESRERYEKERSALLRQVSELRASLETVKGQSDALLTDMRVKHSQAIEERDTRLTELQHTLEVERRSKSALEAGVVSYVGKIQDLEAQLADAENAKDLEQKRIFDLQASFANLRKSQEKLFEEFEGGIVTAQPSSELRMVASPL